jgi:hypothetical protein
MQTPAAPVRPGTVAPTDTLGAFNLYGNVAEAQYQAKLNQQNALWGAGAGLAGAGITAASKIPAVEDTVSNFITPGTGASSYSGLASNASTLGDWMSNPSFASLLPPGVTGTTGVANWSAPSLGLADLGSAAPYAAGTSVASDLSAAAPLAADATAATADAVPAWLSTVLPFLFT